MRTNIKIAFVLFAFLFASAGCGGGGSGSNPSPVGQIVIAPDTGSIVVGGAQQFTAKVYDPNGSLMSGITLTWESTDRTVATINAAGLVNALAPGETVITATSRTIVSNPVPVRVTPGPIATIEVLPLQAAVDLGGEFQFTAIAKDRFGNQVTEVAGVPVGNMSFVWKTVPPEADKVLIDPNGKATGLISGSYQITASTADGMVVGNATSLTVGSCPVDTVPITVEISPSTATAGPGRTVQFTALSKNTAGQILCNNTFIWSMVGSTSVTIDPAAGSATAGTTFETATVKATQGGVSSTASFVVSFFLPPTSYPAGSGPQSVAIADYNSDGLQDLATVNLDSRNISILMNRKAQAGLFDTTVSPGEIANGLLSLTAGLFNGDASPDLAVVDINEGALYTLLNNGDGTMGIFKKILLSGGPVFVASADLNKDNRTDLVTANISADNISILMGDGAAASGFAPPQPFGTGGVGPLFLSIGDFNGDADSDLAIVNSGSGNVSLLLGNGLGAFSSPNAPIAVGTQPVSLVSGKFDRNLTSDIAVVSQENGAVSILLGNGDGTFTPATPMALPAGNVPTSIAAGDFDSDGLDDLAVAVLSPPNDRIILFRNHSDTIGPGRFVEAQRFFVGKNPQQVASGIFASPGPDLAVVNSGSNDVSILLRSK